MLSPRMRLTAGLSDGRQLRHLTPSYVVCTALCHPPNTLAYADYIDSRLVPGCGMLLFCAPFLRWHGRSAGASRFARARDTVAQWQKAFRIRSVDPARRHGDTGPPTPITYSYDNGIDRLRNICAVRFDAGASFAGRNCVPMTHWGFCKVRGRTLRTNDGGTTEK